MLALPVPAIFSGQFRLLIFFLQVKTPEYIVGLELNRHECSVFRTILHLGDRWARFAVGRCWQNLVFRIS